MLSGPGFPCEKEMIGAGVHERFTINTKKFHKVVEKKASLARFMCRCAKMASQKVRPPVLQQFFRISTYHVCLRP